MRHRYITLAALLLVLAGMTTLVSYSVTLYRLFCQVTGANGTTRRVAALDVAPSARMVTVYFDTSVAPGMPWRFAPVQRSVRMHLGEDRLVFFSAENLSDQPVTGHATFNVTPSKAGIYFKKIQCFCFTEERLGPHKRVEMPVDFFVDPKLATDPDTSDVDEITLSYTFFRSKVDAVPRDLARFGKPDAATGGKLFAENCSACHAADHNGVGPALAGVVGRRAGSEAGFAYSAALRGSGIVWNAQTLDRWLAGPQAMVPGAAMPVHVGDAAERRDIVAYLASLRGTGS